MRVPTTENYSKIIPLVVHLNSGYLSQLNNMSYFREQLHNQWTLLPIPIQHVLNHGLLLKVIEMMGLVINEG